MVLKKAVPLQPITFAKWRCPLSVKRRTKRLTAIFMSKNNPFRFIEYKSNTFLFINKMFNNNLRFINQIK